MKEWEAKTYEWLSPFDKSFTGNYFLHKANTFRDFLHKAGLDIKVKSDPQEQNKVGRVFSHKIIVIIALCLGDGTRPFASRTTAILS